jgi:hypothetical protein
MASIGALKTDLEEDPFDEEDMKGYYKRTKAKRDDESDEEDRDDREYYWKINKK